MPPVDTPTNLVLIVGGTIVLVHLAFRSLRARRALVGIPTSAAAGVHIGLNRVRGVARPAGETLIAPVTGTSCAAWSRQVEDEYRKDSTFRFRRRRRWRAVDHQHQEGELDLVDSSGAVRVRLAGAEIVGHRTLCHTLDWSDPDYLALAPPGDGTATGRRRVTELIIPLDHSTTVVGTARLRSDVPAPELAWDPDDGTLLASSISVAVHAGRKIAAAVGWFAAAAALLATAPLAIRPSDTEYAQALRESGRWVPVLLAGTAFVVALYWLQYLHTDLVGLRERVERARSLITVQVSRRHDLLPALADAASGAARHERAAFVNVATARSVHRLAAEAHDIDAVRQVDDADAEAVGRIGAVAEDHPELASSENFQQVQAAIVDAENRLALARSFYNDSVTLYNTRRAALPASLVAGLLGFRPTELYQSAETR